MLAAEELSGEMFSVVSSTEVPIESRISRAQFPKEPPEGCFEEDARDDVGSSCNRSARAARWSVSSFRARFFADFPAYLRLARVVVGVSPT